ncbi:MAG: methyltransferase, partial [Treponema sp.]|nr:methyltransferase [Treponema sp.]
YCELMEKWAKTDVDALNMMDDWGTQRGLLIHPDTWVKIFKPLYRDYIEIARRHNKKIFMHSDGYTLAIYPHLIEMGLDAFNSQIFCMGIDKLVQYSGKICFWGEIDRQHLLPSPDSGLVVKAVSDVYENLWQNGGCIAQCEFGAGARWQNVRKVFETWDKLTGSTGGFVSNGYGSKRRR